MKNVKYKCPICNGSDLTLKHEASYVYSYKIDSDMPGLKNADIFLSYEYDKRENINSREYIECCHCGTQFPYQVLNDMIHAE